MMNNKLDAFLIFLFFFFFKLPYQYSQKVHYVMGLIMITHIYISLQAFIQAWRAACDFKGPSRLLIPGGSFLISQVVFGGPCGGTTPKVVQILGTLKGSTDISEYPEAYWIVFESIVGLVVTGSGKGILDGQGDSVWKYNDCSHSSDCQPLPAVSFCTIFCHYLLLLDKIQVQFFSTIY